MFSVMYDNDKAKISQCLIISMRFEMAAKLKWGYISHQWITLIEQYVAMLECYAYRNGKILFLTHET